MRILLIEDEHKIANAIKRGLEQEHYAVDVVYDGQEGMNFALSEPYDLMIIDRMVPSIKDGLEICQKVREKHIHTPILMLTAMDQLRERVTSLNSGVDDYLVKPFAFEELLARVRSLLRRPSQVLESELIIEDLHLNTTTFQLKRGETEIRLSGKEFALLEYLMRNAGRILTKEMIISHVWDYDADILPNTVEVYIGYLRAKVDKPFSKPPLIQTVRGFGYKIGKRNV